MKNHSTQTHNYQNQAAEFGYFYSFIESTPDKYYAVPKFLFDGKFAKLSSNARLLYAHMRERVAYSIQNKWEDQNGHVYIFFTVKETQNRLHICKNTALKAHKQLIEAGLIEKVNLCFGKPSRIYVKDYVGD